ncbi:hypothetical protein MYK68_14095 [Gordonia sp. PP30]|uniref:hypothetical protein n=1 Tax=Gordonia sp. PP30 TaxID=2935861 RepID=UPI001FFEB7EF|nr:hypothetical protein [Gordonia sp. PP30]UQE73862.1 hypothetical protein MYK68_14095 [Gordonia sp. PP30]
MTALPGLPEHLRTLIVDGHKLHPRSQQMRLGPSEIGNPCARRLAYGLIEAPKAGGFDDPLPSIVGTGMHAQLEELAERANTRLGWPRYLTERRVEIRPGLTGSCDLYDVQEAAVWDWKGPSTNRLRHYRDHGPSAVYRTQAHLYGRGYRRAGFPVKQVGIAFLPRGGWLKDARAWTEPYDDTVVDTALDRIDRILVQLLDLDAEAHPERIRDGWTAGGHQIMPPIPADTTDCFFCSYKALPGTDLAAAPYACPGAGIPAPSNVSEVSASELLNA